MSRNEQSIRDFLSAGRLSKGALHHVQSRESKGFGNLFFFIAHQGSWKGRMNQAQRASERAKVGGSQKS